MAFKFDPQNNLTDSEAEIQKRFEATDKLIKGTFRTYYHEIEPQRLTALWNKVLDADKAFSPTGEAEKITEAFDAFLAEINADLERVGGNVTDIQIKQIHATQSKQRIDEQRYRAELEKLGAASSKELKFYEAKILIERLKKITGGR